MIASKNTGFCAAFYLRRGLTGGEAVTAKRRRASCSRRAHPTAHSSLSRLQRLSSTETVVATTPGASALWPLLSPLPSYFTCAEGSRILEPRLVHPVRPVRAPKKLHTRHLQTPVVEMVKLPRGEVNLARQKTGYISTSLHTTQVGYTVHQVPET
jgi:hypothetical protein